MHTDAVFLLVKYVFLGHTMEAFDINIYESWRMGMENCWEQNLPVMTDEVCWLIKLMSLTCYRRLRNHEIT